MKFELTLSCSAAALAIAGFAAFASIGVSPASARTSRNTVRYNQSPEANAPVLAIVGLREQHVTIYDAKGKILQSPVSSGAPGYETPAGIYSIVQKEEDHHSNVYDDASMPFMERITWTGIALHAGVLPGSPASHGCVRMPLAFAQQLYQITKLGMRVIVVREDIAPVGIAQPALFSSGKTAGIFGLERASSAEGASSAINVSSTPADHDILPRLQSIAAAKSREAEAAAKREKELRLAATKASAEASPAVKALRDAETSLAKAEAELNTIEAAPVTDDPERTAKTEAAKAQARAKVDGLRTQLDAAKQQAQSKLDMAAQAKLEAQSAVVALSAALDAAEHASQNTRPVSVFVSRKTQRLYIRKGNLPVYESPVMIRDASNPIGSFVFTALDYGGSSGELRWNVVSMYKDPLNVQPPAAEDKRGRTKASHPSEPAPADTTAAQAALDRLVVPQEAANRISEVVLPGSSLIISDEGPSIETGKDTDFVVVMSGEPQGGLTIRRRESRRGRGDDDDDFRGRSRSFRSWGGFSLFSDD